MIILKVKNTRAEGVRDRLMKRAVNESVRIF